MRFFKPDAWTGWHLFGSFALARLISHVPDIAMWQAAVVALLLGCIWEGFDDQFRGRWIFDPRGASIDDLLADAIGCSLAIFV